MLCLVTSCMRGNSSPGDLAPLYLEIEATCRRNNAERRRKALQERAVQPSSKRTCSSESSSAFLANLRESEVGASEAHNMADEQPQRVTLEDYSSYSMP